MSNKKSYRLGTWNLKVGNAIGQVPKVLKRMSVDSMVVQEISGGGDSVGSRKRKANRLRKAVGKWKLRLSKNRESGIIVASGVRLTNVRRHNLTSMGWERGKGRKGLHPARKTVSGRLGPLGRLGIRFLNVHIPPNPSAWTLRGRARTQALKRVEKIFKRWNRAIELGNIGGWVGSGDWNHKANDPEIIALAKRVNAVVVGSGVDFSLVSKTLTVTDHGVGPDLDESDHRPKFVEVEL